MLFVRYGAIGCLCCGLFFLGGCGGSSMHETWKSTKGLYYEYLNPPASIDYDDTGDLNASQARLANNMRPIDEELTRFERYMMNQDKPPSQERVDALFSRFKWVNGVVALSPEGEVLAQEPPTDMKQLDYAAFVSEERKNSRELRGDVQMTPLGPEVLLGMPIYASSELKGYFAAHFDIRVLVDRSPDPSGLIILSPQGTLWGGSADAAGSALDGREWADIVKSRIAGRMDGYVWVCRYYGGVPLIFASPETDGPVAKNVASDDAAAPAEQHEAVAEEETRPAVSADDSATAPASEEAADKTAGNKAGQNEE